MRTATTVLAERFRPDEAVTSTPVGTGVVALHLGSGIYYSFNELGALVWRALTRGDTRASITEQIVAEYEISQESAALDVDEFVRHLVEWNLVSPA